MNSIIEAFPNFANKDVRVVYNVHNADNIFRKAKEELTIEERQIINENTLLYIGRLDKNKAPKRALDAFLLSLESLPKEANLCFIGKDAQNLQQEMESLVKESRFKHRIHFFGFQSNPYKFLSKSKGLISCSYSEGLPGVMIESLFLSKPVVTTNSSAGIWEILSCIDSYNSQLDKMYQCQDGIITSNLSSTDSGLYNKDVANLSEGIKQLYKRKTTPTFAFQSQINKDVIIHNLTD